MGMEQLQAARYTGLSHPAVFEMNDEVGLTLKVIKYEAVESHV